MTETSDNTDPRPENLHTGQKTPTAGSYTGNAFAGLGLGLLVGSIAGLSVSPVVSVILGSLAALLAAFLGLGGATLKAGTATDPAGQLANRRLMDGIRAGSFGLACVAGLLSGMFIRTNDAFIPTVEQDVSNWVNAGYPASEARQYVVFERLGIRPKWESVEFADVQKRRTSGLFSGENESGICDEIRPERFENDSDEILYAYSQQGLEELADLADIIKQLQINEPDLQQLLAAVSETLCEFESTLTKSGS